MGMGIVSNSDFDNELENLTKLPPIPLGGTKGKGKAIVESIPTKGRDINGMEVPDSLRKLIGNESITNGRQSALELADKFSVSPSSVSAYSQGAHSTSTYGIRPDESGINEARLRITKKARNRLTLALNSITQEKIDSAKVRDIAGVAKDMSAIISNMESKGSKAEGDNGPTFIFYSPQTRSEKVFDMIQVKE